MNSLFFIAWIASGTIHAVGVTQGSLGRESNESANACAALEDLKTDSPNQKFQVFDVERSTIGLCDFGCTHEVSVDEVVCDKEVIPQEERIITRPKAGSK